MLDQYPVTPYLSSRESFMKWIHYINNKINKKMEWNELSFRESLEKYYELYKPDSIKKRDLYRERKKYIQFGFLIGGIGITYYLYRK